MRAGGLSFSLAQRWGCVRCAPRPITEKYQPDLELRDHRTTLMVAQAGLPALGPVLITFLLLLRWNAPRIKEGKVYLAHG